MSTNLPILEKDESYVATKKQKAFDKVSRIPIKVVHREPLKKPSWIRVKTAPANSQFNHIKDILRKNKIIIKSTRYMSKFCIFSIQKDHPIVHFLQSGGLVRIGLFWCLLQESLLGKEIIYRYN